MSESRRANNTQDHTREPSIPMRAARSAAGVTVFLVLGSYLPIYLFEEGAGREAEPINIGGGELVVVLLTAPVMLGLVFVVGCLLLKLRHS